MIWALTGFIRMSGSEQFSAPPSICKMSYICRGDSRIARQVIWYFILTQTQHQVLPMLPQRKSNRLKYYDYNSRGAYFITICTANRNPILAEIRKGNETERISHTLLPCGIAAVSVIDKLSERFPIHLSAYVMMPDHVHLLFWLTDDQPELRAIHESPLQETVSSETERAMVSKIIGYMKMHVTKIVHRQYPGLPVWQRGYYDHIIRNRDDFRQTALYIRNNPMKWAYDKKIIP